jgi:hypothetical protein
MSHNLLYQLAQFHTLVAVVVDRNTTTKVSNIHLPCNIKGYDSMMGMMAGSYIKVVVWSYVLTINSIR